MRNFRIGLLGKVPSDDAWRRVKPFGKIEAPRQRFLDDSELRRLVNSIDADFRPLVMATLYTGGRYAEVASLSVRNFDKQSRSVTFADTKSGEVRHSALDDEGMRHFEFHVAGKLSGALIFPRPDGRQWAASQQARFMDRACKAANIEKAVFHDLRRSYGARLARKNVSMQIIAHAMGHKGTHVTERHYAHLAPSHIADKIRDGISGLGLSADSNLVALKIA